MKRSLILCLFLIALQTGSHAQRWRSLGNGFNNQVSALYADTVNNLLYAGGYFQFSGTTYLGSYGVWDGNNWMDLDSGTTCYPSLGGEPWSLGWVDNKLIAVGNVYFCNNPISSRYLNYWDGQNWLGSGTTDAPADFRNLHGESFAVGMFDLFDGDPIKRVARWNGNNWEQFGDTAQLGRIYRVNDVCNFRGDYYIAGNFSLPPPSPEIWRWTGNSFEAPGGGLLGDTWVNRLIVYQDKLWVGGEFYAQDGNAGSYIMTWDGQQWEYPFRNVFYDGQIKDMVIAGGYLYLVGMHYIFENGAWRGPRWLARYDGQDFCSFGGSEYVMAGRVAALGERVFFTASMPQEPWADSLKFIAEWVGGDDMDFCVPQVITSNGPTNNLPPLYAALSPNPATGGITSLEFNFQKPGNLSLQLNDIQGKTVWESAYPVFMPGDHRLPLDFSSLEAGLYFLHCKSSEYRDVTLKVVLE